jgi:hypothetical protein
VTAVKAAPAREDSAASEAGLSAKLLHALNQPLTGLQCALELALSGPQAAEKYVACLRGGLELTERMRNLVGAMRELMEIEGAVAETREKIELRSVLGETLAELQPVIEAKGMRVAVDCAALPVEAGRRGLTSSMFRLLESAIALAAPGSVFSITSSAEGVWAVRMGWSCSEPAPAQSEFSPAQLGVMLAQAGLRRAGVDAAREQANDMGLITLRARGGAERTTAQSEANHQAAALP